MNLNTQKVSRSMSFVNFVGSMSRPPRQPFAVVAMAMGLICGLQFNSLGAYQEQQQSQKQSAQTPKLATVKGQVAIPDAWKATIKADAIPLEMIAQVEIPDPKFPDNWQQMTVAEQEAWWQKFEQSEEGQAYIREGQAKIDNAPRFKVRIEADGRFVVFDVPPAVYILRGRLDQKVNNQDYAFELFGELVVQTGVDEVVVKAIDCVVTPIIQPGQVAPDFNLVTTDKSQVTKKTFADKYLLISFWAATSPPSSEFQKTIHTAMQKIRETQAVELLSISMDQNVEDIAEFIATHGSQGPVALAGGWQSPVVRAFGVNGIPSVWLIDPQGNVAMTSGQLGYALRTSGLPLAEIVTYRIDGKELPDRTKTEQADKKTDK